MEIFDTIYKPNTLNIFTDASIYPVQNSFIGCAGVELATSGSRIDVTNNLFTNGYIPNYTVITNTTNNHSELTAIRQGILFAIANKGRFEKINLFSDSLISVNSLNSWIIGWIFKALRSGKRKEEIQLITSSGSPVANQELIKEIATLIYYENLNIKIYHQRGHCSNNLNLVKRDFIKINGIKTKVTDSFIKEITEMNDLVDRRSRDILKDYVGMGYAPYVRDNTIPSGIVYDVSSIYLRKYKQLIGKEGK